MILKSTDLHNQNFYLNSTFLLQRKICRFITLSICPLKKDIRILPRYYCSPTAIQKKQLPILES